MQMRKLSKSHLELASLSLQISSLIAEKNSEKVLFPGAYF